MKALRTIVLLAACTPALHAQDSPAPVTFEQASASARRDLEASLAELATLRERVAAEKLPLVRRLHELETELVRVRAEFQEASRTLDGRTLELANLRAEAAARGEESSYLQSLLGDYARSFESRLHVVELDRYAAVLEAARLASENRGLSPGETLLAQTAVLAASLERAHEALGGARFEGAAVDGTGRVTEGTFVLVGPAAVFRSGDGLVIGTAEQRLGSIAPAAIAFRDPQHADAVSALVAGSSGAFPLDPTLGDAHKIEETDETWREHVAKGGPVMIPIFALAGAALLVVLYKWLSMMRVRAPSKRRVAALLEAVGKGDRQAALREADAVGGPAGAMLRAGVEHLGEPRELVEEVMYETVLATKLRLNRFLPFVAITASSAPLLGLLGTVTGIMNTFKLITVFGTGDVKTLSSGISEALITTEYGLIVAIPSLLLHAFLSRKARSVVDQMESSAVALLNAVSRTTAEPDGGGVGGGGTPRGAHERSPRSPRAPAAQPDAPAIRREVPAGS